MLLTYHAPRTTHHDNGPRTTHHDNAPRTIITYHPTSSTDPTMAIWEKLRTELDRAGKAAQGALDEGRLRLDAHRARKRADKAAQVLGYAVYRARTANADVTGDVYSGYAADIASHETEALRLETLLSELEGRGKM